MIGFAPLLQLPLFMGMARDDLQQIVAHTKFDFFKRPADSKVISEGDRCEAVVILTHGSLSVEKQSDDHGYGVREIVNRPPLSFSLSISSVSPSVIPPLSLLSLHAISCPSPNRR